MVRPVQYTVAPASPSATAVPRPAPRVAPATRATLPSSGPGIVRDDAAHMPDVEIRNLSEALRPVEAVRACFEVEAGRVTGFLGPNGAGKRTTLRALLGLVRPTGGTALFGGRRYDELEGPSPHVGALLEEAWFHPGRTGATTCGCSRGGRPPRERVEELLAKVGMAGADDRRVKGYSLGMRERLAIAAALLGDPEVLILDEPTNGLDPQGIRWLRGLVRDQAAHRARGTGLQPPAR